MWTTIANLKSNITAIATDVLDTKDELESGDYSNYDGDDYSGGLGLESPYRSPSSAPYTPSSSDHQNRFLSTSKNYGVVESPKVPTPSWNPLQNSRPSPLTSEHNAEV